MTDKRLYIPMRECVGCGRTAVNGAKLAGPDEPVIVAITPVFYLRRSSGRKIKNAPKVQVCEECLVKATTQGRLHWPGSTSEKVWNAFRQSFQTCYSKLTKQESASV